MRCQRIFVAEWPPAGRHGAGRPRRITSARNPADMLVLRLGGLPVGPPGDDAAVTVRRPENRAHHETWPATRPRWHGGHEPCRSRRRGGSHRAGVRAARVRSPCPAPREPTVEPRCAPPPMPRRARRKRHAPQLACVSRRGHGSVPHHAAPAGTAMSLAAAPERTSSAGRVKETAMPYTLLVEQDVALPTRDGGTVRANIFRPAEAGKFP